MPSSTRSDRERPHQALGMTVPADVYARVSRVYRGLSVLRRSEWVDHLAPGIQLEV